jgi:hypothetical protein
MRLRHPLLDIASTKSKQNSHTWPGFPRPNEINDAKRNRSYAFAASRLLRVNQRQKISLSGFARKDRAIENEPLPSLIPDTETFA